MLSVEVPGIGEDDTASEILEPPKHDAYATPKLDVAVRIRK